MTYPRLLKKPALYVRIDLVGGGATLRFSERTHYRFGYEWIGIIFNASGRNPGFDPVSMEVSNGSYTLTLNNSKPVFGLDRFSNLMVSNNLVTSEVWVYWAHEDSDALKTIYYGICDSLTEIRAETCSLNLVDYVTLLEKRKPFSTATYEDYPGMDPDDLGRVIPMIYGSPLRVPMLSVDAGGKSTMITNLLATQLTGTFEVSDASRMPFSDPFTVQIDSELIRISSRNNDTLTIGERGYNSTEVVDHDAGAAIAEIQTGYPYLLANHPVTSITNVFVESIKQPSALYTAYTGQPGNEYPSIPGKAVVVFNTLPSIYKQTNMALEDNIRFWDGSEPNDGWSKYYSEEEIQEVFRLKDDGHTHAGDEASVATLSASCLTNCENCLCSYSLRPTWGFNTMNMTEGTPRYFRITFEYEVMKQVASLAAPIACRFNGVDQDYQFQCVGTVGKHIERYPDVGAPGYAIGYPDNTAQFHPLDGENRTFEYFYHGFFEFVNFGGGYPDGYLLIRRLEIEIVYDPILSKSGNQPVLGQTPSGTLYRIGTVTLTGNSSADLVIGRDVAANVTGYSQTKPDEIRKHMLVNLYGLTSANYDSESFDEAGAQFDGRNYYFNVVLNEKMSFKEVQEMFLKQSRTALYWVGDKEYMRFIPLPGD